jgi:hypothetical protein
MDRHDRHSLTAWTDALQVLRCGAGYLALVAAGRSYRPVDARPARKIVFDELGDTVRFLNGDREHEADGAPGRYLLLIGNLGERIRCHDADGGVRPASNAGETGNQHDGNPDQTEDSD